MEGISVPCTATYCDKTFRTRDAMRQHASKHRKIFKTNNTLALQKKKIA